MQKYRKAYKKVIIFLFIYAFLPASAFAFTVPEKPTGFVHDFAGIMLANQVANLELKLQNYEKTSTNEIAVVIVESLDGDVIENVAQDIFTKWGIGKEGKNNGVLLLVALSERKTRIHTGYGVEGDLTDLGTSYIQQEVIVPAFREEKYYEGIDGAIDKMILALRGNEIVPEDYTESSNINWEFAFIILFVALQWVGAILARSKSWWGGGVLGGVFGAVIWFIGFFTIIPSIIILFLLIAFGLGFDYIVSKTYKDIKKQHGHFPWWIGGGGFGGGKGGGGFGGFGGGSSGGGGSSSSW